MIRSYRTEGIVIKRNNYSEADRIITIFTKDQGKISIKASGVRKIISRRSAHVEPLNHVLITLHRGNKFPILGEAQTIESYDEIKQDLSKVGHAYHVCEIIDGLCPENQENIRVFFLLKNILHLMSKEIITNEMVDAFEVGLLTELGFWNNTFMTKNLDNQDFIENILERRLKSRRIFSKLQ